MSEMTLRRLTVDEAMDLFFMGTTKDGTLALGPGAASAILAGRRQLQDARPALPADTTPVVVAEAIGKLAISTHESFAQLNHDMATLGAEIIRTCGYAVPLCAECGARKVYACPQETAAAQAAQTALRGVVAERNTLTAASLQAQGWLERALVRAAVNLGRYYDCNPDVGFGPTPAQLVAEVLTDSGLTLDAKATWRVVTCVSGVRARR